MHQFPWCHTMQVAARAMEFHMLMDMLEHWVDSDRKPLTSVWRVNFK